MRFLKNSVFKFLIKTKCREKIKITKLIKYEQYINKIRIRFNRIILIAFLFCVLRKNKIAVEKDKKEKSCNSYTLSNTFQHEEDSKAFELLECLYVKSMHKFFRKSEKFSIFYFNENSALVYLNSIC